MMPWRSSLVLLALCAAAWAEPRPGRAGKTPDLAVLVDRAAVAVADGIVEGAPIAQPQIRRRFVREALGPAAALRVRCEDRQRCPRARTTLGDAILAWLTVNPGQHYLQVIQAEADRVLAPLNGYRGLIARLDPKNRPRAVTGSGRALARLMTPKLDAIWEAMGAAGDPLEALSLRDADRLERTAEALATLVDRHPCPRDDAGCVALSELRFDVNSVVRTVQDAAEGMGRVVALRSLLRDPLRAWVEDNQLSLRAGAPVPVPASGPFERWAAVAVDALERAGAGREEGALRSALQGALAADSALPVRCADRTVCPRPTARLSEVLLRWLRARTEGQHAVAFRRQLRRARVARQDRARTVDTYAPDQWPVPSTEQDRRARARYAPRITRLWADIERFRDPSVRATDATLPTVWAHSDALRAIEKVKCAEPESVCHQTWSKAFDSRAVPRAFEREAYEDRQRDRHLARLRGDLAGWLEDVQLQRVSSEANAAPASCGPAGRRLALVVGIDRYAQGVAPLRGARRDALRMAAVLRARGYRVTLLLDEEATLAALRAALGDTLRRESRREDQVLVYFAGHGITVGDGPAAQGYLLPVDAKGDGVASALAMREVVDLLGTYEARHRLFLADACYSGLAVSSTRRVVRADQPIGCTTATQAPATVVLVAGGRGELAHETEAGGVFTSAVIDALNGRAPGAADGWLSHLHLAAHVTAVVPAEVARRWQQRQTPQVGKVGEGVVHLPVASPRRPPPP